MFKCFSVLLYIFRTFFQQYFCIIIKYFGNFKLNVNLFRKFGKCWWRVSLHSKAWVKEAVFPLWEEIYNWQYITHLFYKVADISPPDYAFMTVSTQTFSCSNLAVETLRKSREVCSKLTTKTPEIPELRQERRSGVFIVNFEHFLYLLLLMTLNKQMFVGLILRSLNNCFSSGCTRNLINMFFRFLLEPTPFSFDGVRWSNLFGNFFPS